MCLASANPRYKPGTGETGDARRTIRQAPLIAFDSLLLGMPLILPMTINLEIAAAPLSAVLITEWDLRRLSPGISPDIESVDLEFSRDEDGDLERSSNDDDGEPKST